MHLKKYYTLFIVSAILCGLLAPVSSMILNDIQSLREKIPPSQIIPEQLVDIPLFNPMSQGQIIAKAQGLMTRLIGGIAQVNQDLVLIYKGLTGTLLNENFTSTSYYISFSKNTTDCTYTSCYYGWVDNYTINTNTTFEGYPKSTDPVKPVFEFRTNSKTDFVIIRHPQLNDVFVSIIEIGCEQFQPTITKVARDESSGVKLTSGSASKIDYVFISEADFNRTKPEDTSKIDPTLLKSGSGTVKVDKDYKMLQRSKLISLIIPSDKFTDDPNEKSVTFILNITIDFTLSGGTTTNNENLKAYIDSFTNPGIQKQSYLFTASTIESLRTDPKKQIIHNVIFLKDQPQPTPSSTPPISILIPPSICKPLPQKILLFEMKQLFSKLVMGRTLKVFMRIYAVLVNSTTSRIQCQIKYNFFGYEKVVQVWDELRDIMKEWKLPQDFGGKLEFQIYVPLPSPISALGINYKFSILLKQISLLQINSKTSNVSCNYLSLLQIITKTKVTTFANATVRTLGAQSGIILVGNLITLTSTFLEELQINLNAAAVQARSVWVKTKDPFSFFWAFRSRQWLANSTWGAQKIGPAYSTDVKNSTKQTIYQSVTNL